MTTLSGASQPGARTLPVPRRVDQVDDYFGTAVADPYRWMEDLTDPELPAWLAAQEALTAEVLGAVPGREAVASRLRDLLGVRSLRLGRQRGGRWFTTREIGDTGRDGVVVAATPTAEGRLVVDPAPLGEGVMVADSEPSRDGRRLLWAASQGGSDWRHWRVVDVDSGAILDEAVTDSKLWAGWLPGGEAFMYIGFRGDAGGDQRRATSVPQLRVHRLGTPAAEDRVVFEEPDRPRYFFPLITEDGAHCALSFVIADGEVAVAALDGSWRFATLASSAEPMWCLGGEGGKFLVATTHGAPYGRVVAIDEADPSEASWRDVVPETGDPLRPVARVTRVGDWLHVVHDRLGRSVHTMHRVDGGESYALQLPVEAEFVPRDADAPASATEDGTAVYFAVTTPASPGLLLRHTVGTRVAEVVDRSDSDTALQVVSEVVWATSQDGTRVPMTLVRAAATDAIAAPVVVEGYGGGGDSMEPFHYEPWKVAWLEAGGQVASAHLRGGNELGSAWQRAAERGGKLLAMQDFVACAEALRERGTPAERIACKGRSSGAMLAAAAAVSRPDAVAACVAEVGMFDPLRYHNFGLGRLMIHEYGTSEDPGDLRAMLAYSPLHNVRPGVRYPAFLMTVHTDDDRVAPGGPYKMTATLQAAQSGTAPVLLRLRANAGHHGGTLDGAIGELSDILAFLSMTLGLPLAG